MHYLSAMNAKIEVAQKQSDKWEKTLERLLNQKKNYISEKNNYISEKKKIVNQRKKETAHLKAQLNKLHTAYERQREALQKELSKGIERQQLAEDDLTRALQDSSSTEFVCSSSAAPAEMP